MHVTQGAENVNKPGQVVLRLAENILSDRNFKIFFDKWFYSPGFQIALALRNIWSVGTLVLKRAPGLKFDSESQPKRGWYSIKTSKIQRVNFAATQWLDNKPVTILSSFCASHLQGSAQQFDRNKNQFVTIVAPQCILTYKKHMGYVDEINSYLGRFRVTTPCRSRAHVKIFLSFVTIVATNCWLEYSRDCDQQETPRKSRLSLYSFKTMIAESLCKANVCEKNISRQG